MVQNFQLQHRALGRCVGSSIWTIMGVNKNKKVHPALCRLKKGKLWKEGEKKKTKQTTNQEMWNYVFCEIK